jgi:hypothetical protein
MWPLLSAANSTSPRTEVVLTPLSGDRYNGSNTKSGDAALIVGRHKLIVGDIAQASWCGIDYPNASVAWDTWSTILNCTRPGKRGCLFDIFADPHEHHDMAEEMPGPRPANPWTRTDQPR